MSSSPNFSKPDHPAFCADQAYDEKNIRRRVYDALNVLMAMNIIAKRKKEIMWKGLPATGDGDVAHLRAEKARARARGLNRKRAPRRARRAVQLVPGAAAAQRGARGDGGDAQRDRAAVHPGADQALGDGGGGDLGGPAGGALRLQRHALPDPRREPRPGQHEPRRGESQTARRRRRRKRRRRGDGARRPAGRGSRRPAGAAAGKKLEPKPEPKVPPVAAARTTRGVKAGGGKR